MRHVPSAAAYPSPLPTPLDSFSTASFPSVSSCPARSPSRTLMSVSPCRPSRATRACAACTAASVPPTACSSPSPRSVRPSLTVCLQARRITPPRAPVTEARVPATAHCVAVYWVAAAGRRPQPKRKRKTKTKSKPCAGALLRAHHMLPQVRIGMYDMQAR